MSSPNIIDVRERLNQRKRQIARARYPTSTSQTTRAKEMLVVVMDKLDDIRMELDVEGPLIKSLPFLNGVINVLLTLSSWLIRGRGRAGVPEQMWLYLLLPCIMLGMVEMARWTIFAEHQELGRLKGLRYGYKGA